MSSSVTVHVVAARQGHMICCGITSLQNVCAVIRWCFADAETAAAFAAAFPPDGDVVNHYVKSEAEDPQ